MFIARFSSEGNLEKGTVYIQAKNIKDAQDKFFDYLKTTQLYQHMWNLTLSIEEVEEPIFLK